MRSRTRVRTYSELLTFDTFEDRFRYLNLQGQVGDVNFGHDRWINQAFYRSREWKQIREYCIARDLGLDLAFPDHPIHYPAPHVHHMNPMVAEDIVQHDDDILNPEFLITVAANTHNAIHFGNEDLLPQPWEPRRPGDTAPWRD